MPSAIRTVTLQAALLNVTSSVLAQLLTLYRKSTFASEPTLLNPLGLDFTPILRFLIFCLVTTPPNFLWQGYLERRFPAYPMQDAQSKKVKVDDDGKGVVVQKKINVKNTALKILMDQTVGAGVNTMLFILAMRAMKGGSLEECIKAVQNDFWPLVFAAAKVWPLVSILCFTVVPVEKRIIVGSLVGVVWGVFMALRT
ncbi:MAG: hypothetical protein MMC33_003304 [Icmadophila ericetorum]|nr:hypothetical protein [Icmadophila ericetorum]